MEIQAFLTAYDPSDLPGTSLDPLGFESGYLFLAEKILPGLTNVASRPRYFSMLCAGAYLAGNLFHESPRTQYNRRLSRLTRLERFWALANVLAASKNGDIEDKLGGLRGVTYAQSKVDEVLRKGDQFVDTEFRLLSRQVQYGAVGIYGSVADRMRFIDRQVLALSPDLGEKLAKGFIRETSMPKTIERAIEENGSVSVRTLSSWGERAHISGVVGKTEANCLRDALHLEPTRSRMAELLDHFPALKDESELKRLFRILASLKSNKENMDLKEAIDAILSYESSYQLSLLAFERLLWLCRMDQAGSVSKDTLAVDQVLKRVQSMLPRIVSKFLKVLEKAYTDNFRRDLHRLDDVKLFLQDAQASCDNSEAFIGCIMARHTDIQRGKLDRGRRKMPWLEYVPHDRISLTTTRVGGRRKEVTKPTDISPHLYRLYSADALIRASRA